MTRRVGLPTPFVDLRPKLFRDPALPVPESYTARGRWKRGPMHTFCDDYRQEFFWRRPEEGLLVASVAGFMTAPDFTVWLDDPVEWARYQVWRSAVVAAYWALHGVDVLPVVALAGHPYRFVEAGSAWAIRGPATEDRAFIRALESWATRCSPGLLVVFGRPIQSIGVPMVNRRLFSSTGKTAAQIEG